MGDEKEEPKGRRPSMMILMNTMTNQMRRFSEINVELDQSLKGLGIVLLLAVVFVIFVYCFNWLEFYLFLFDNKAKEKR